MSKGVKKNLCLLISTVLFVHGSVASSEVVVRSPDSNRYVYQAEVETHPLYESYVNYSQKALPSLKAKEIFQEKFKKAQMSYLSNEPHYALFLEVVKEAYLYDWKAPEREALYFSFLRLSQEARDLEDQKKWMNQAIHFQGDALADQLPWHKSMPLKIKKRFEKIKQKQKAQAIIWHPSEELKEYELIILDGRRIPNQIGLEVLIFPGRHRLTLVSNVFPLWTQVMEQGEFENLSVSSKPFVSGPCNDTKINSYPSGTKEFHVWHNQDCILKFNSEKIVPIVDLDIIPQKTTLLEEKMKVLPENKSVNRWVLMGLGAAAVFFTGYQYNAQSGRRIKIVKQREK